MAEKNKIAVIGAGITGLYTALKLAEKGYKVSVFEKNRSVGLKPCSSLISERIKEHLPIPDNLEQRRVNSVLVHFPRKDIELRPKPCFLLFERKELDEFAFGLAKRAGVEFFFEKEIRELPQGFDKIILCSGALAGECSDYRLGVQYFAEEDSDERIQIWPINKGFLWKIPRRENVEYGGIGPAREFLKGLEIFLADRDIVLEKQKIKAALIPQGLSFSKKDKLFLLGDAACLTKPTTGGGVIWGMTAADILIDNFSDFGKAKAEIKKFFRHKILKGKLEAELGCFAGNRFSFLLPKKISIDADLF